MLNKFSFVLFFFGILTTFACSKSTTTTTNVPADIVGSWSGVTFSSNYTVGGGQTRTFTNVAVTQPLAVKFNDDGTYIDYGVFDVTTSATNNTYANNSGTFLVRNDTIRILPTNQTSTQSSYAIYKVSGANVTFTIDKSLIALSGNTALNSAVSSFDKFSIVYTFKKL